MLSVFKVPHRIDRRSERFHLIQLQNFKKPILDLILGNEIQKRCFGRLIRMKYGYKQCEISYIDKSEVKYQ